jgi:hypothetical protein
MVNNPEEPEGDIGTAVSIVNDPDPPVTIGTVPVSVFEG